MLSSVGLRFSLHGCKFISGPSLSKTLTRSIPRAQLLTSTPYAREMPALPILLFQVRSQIMCAFTSTSRIDWKEIQFITILNLTTVLLYATAKIFPSRNRVHMAFLLVIKATTLPPVIVTCPDPTSMRSSNHDWTAGDSTDEGATVRWVFVIQIVFDVRTYMHESLLDFKWYSISY